MDITTKNKTHINKKMQYCRLESANICLCMGKWLRFNVFQEDVFYFVDKIRFYSYFQVKIVVISRASVQGVDYRLLQSNKLSINRKIIRWKIFTFHCHSCIHNSSVNYHWFHIVFRQMSLLVSFLKYNFKWYVFKSSSKWLSLIWHIQIRLNFIVFLFKT